eukprot:TRINITY_DN82802_c0_g1_i1.p1 TRINITY_DN82802_c0_g1~~TRINITY_DN82802_c0_g1_i1.p1  ORF type:complete len:317 (+),score=52.74 TRINITY_DN82802_c0_g1_i1:188-1138(+)
MLLVTVRRVRKTLSEQQELVSQLGAAVIFMAICMISAFIMLELEEPAELEKLKVAAAAWDDVDAKRASAVTALRQHLLATGAHPELTAHIDFLNDALSSASGDRPLSAGDVSDGDHNWTFFGSLYFVFTVVTTIGYGTFAPVTTGGRVFTIVLAFVGTASYAYFVERLSNGFQHLLEFLATRWKVPTSRRAALGLALVMLYWLFGALAFEALAYDAGDHWTYGESIYYAAITFTTIGFGDYSLRWYGDHRGLEVVGLIFFATIGLVVFIEFGNTTIELISSLRGNVKDKLETVEPSTSGPVKEAWSGDQKVAAELQ